MLLLGRFCHSYGLADNVMKLRAFGMILTFLTLVISAFMLLVTQVM